jgi:hypothetical protein
MEAKARRDVVRCEIVKALRAGADALEIAALLKADEIAGRELAEAQQAYSADQIPDFLVAPTERQAA